MAAQATIATLGNSRLLKTLALRLNIPLFAST